MSFSSRLKELRETTKMSQRVLARHLDMANSTLAMYETGKREPDFKTLQTIADFFQVSTDYLLGRTDIMQPPGDMTINIQYVEMIREWEKEGRTPEEVRDLWKKLADIASRYKPK